MSWSLKAALLGCVLASPACAGSVLHLPNIPQRAGQAAALLLQNNGPKPISPHYITTGIVFPSGAVPAGHHLRAELGSAGTITPVQMDERTHWPNGSVRTAALSFRQPAYPAGGSGAVALMLDSASSRPPLSLSSITPGVATVTLTIGSTVHHLDVATLLASGTPNYWLKGPLATEARVDAPISGALHVTIDVRVYADGSSMLDVVFANDLAQAHGAAVTYDVVMKLGGTTLPAVNIRNQQPFTNWHRRLWSSGAPEVNVVHDVRVLEQTGMIPRYPLAAGVPASSITGEVVKSELCRPLGPCNVTPSMPETGGRADIGLVPMWDVLWLQTQDQHAANFALAQVNHAAGAIPWHVEQAPGVPVDVVQHAKWWSDDRCKQNGNKDCSPMSYLAASNGSGNGVPIIPDTAHQPEMAYVPYLLTDTRYYLDELAAQAGYSESSAWPYIRDYGRDYGGAGGVGVIGSAQQLRAAAWSIRELSLASLVEPDGSALKAYFANASAENMAYTAKLARNPAKGQMIGWIDSTYTTGAIAPWQEDYFSLSLEWEIHAGIPGASTALAAMTPFLVNRFIQPPGTFSPYDATSYILMVGPSASQDFTTWAQSELATIARGTSNTTPPLGPEPGTWAGDYGTAATSVIQGLPKSAGQQAALAWINANPAPLSVNPAWIINP